MNRILKMEVPIKRMRHCSSSYYNANKKKKLGNNTRTRGFQKTQVGSNNREFCGDGLEPHKDRRSQWVLLITVTKEDDFFLLNELCEI